MTLNQPAGHLENGESLIEAVIRETQEETAWQFQPVAIIGIYRWQRQEKGLTFLRFCFSGHVTTHDPAQPLDADIHQAVWLTWEELQARQGQFRGPLVQRCLDDYRAGCLYPLTLLKNENI